MNCWPFNLWFIIVLPSILFDKIFLICVIPETNSGLSSSSGIANKFWRLHSESVGRTRQTHSLSEKKSRITFLILFFCWMFSLTPLTSVNAFSNYCRIVISFWLTSTNFKLKSRTTHSSFGNAFIFVTSCPLEISLNSLILKFLARSKTSDKFCKLFSSIAPLQF